MNVEVNRPAPLVDQTGLSLQTAAVKSTLIPVGTAGRENSAFDLLDRSRPAAPDS